MIGATEVRILGCMAMFKGAWALAGLVAVGLAYQLKATEGEVRVIWQHELTSIPADSENRGGEFGVDGWTAQAVKGFLRVTLPEPAPRDATLSVEVRGTSPARLAQRVGADRKIHFFNLFSNPIGDHHGEDGGTASDALWSLRTGTAADGGGRYRDGLKLLWASRGAKRTAGSDYHEKSFTLPEGIEPLHERWVEYRVEWSESAGDLRVWIDGRIAITAPWKHRGDPLRHVFLGGAADFASLSGATFRRLRLTTLAAPGR